jgi:cytochrome P450
VLGRSTVKDTVLADHAIPADTLVAVNLSRLHRDPDVWPDPLAFDPGRFSGERREDKVHRHAYEPFGGGVHKCIGMFFAGMQVKAILHQVLLSCRFACPDGYTMHTNWRGLPTPSEGVPLVLERC